MTLAADTSITIPALVADHHARERSEDALKRCTVTIAHTAVETYSVLTRLPAPHRLIPADAARLIDARLPPAYVALDRHMHAGVHTRLAAADVAGGSTYDGLIALTALQHGLELLTRDRRAERTYRALRVPYRLLH